jgi:hypothetical protein
MFRFHVTIGTHIRSNAFALNQFYVLNDVITSDISDPVIQATRKFNSNAHIAFNIVSSADSNKSFAVNAGIVSDISSDIEKTNSITVQANIGTVIASDIRQPYLFSVQADIGIGIASNAGAERLLATQADISTGIVSGITNLRQFSVAPVIAFAINDVHAPVEKRFRSVPFVMIDVRMATWPGGLYQRMSFATSPFVMVWTWSAINQPMNFTSQANIVTDISAAGNVRRELVVSANTTFDLSSTMGSGIVLTSAPAITFSTVSDAFKESRFGSLPEMTFDFSANILNERRFSTQADIVFGISDLFHIYVTRNLGSTVNIIVDLESLNILNMVIDDLFPTKIKSLTPKRTATLIGV